ncbi:hypothetical protein [Shewanella sp. HL-SH2]
MNPCLVLLLAMLMAGCAQKITAINTDQDKKLDTLMGYLLISIDTNSKLDSISIDGDSDFIFTEENLQPGSNFIIAEIPAGAYSFERIKLNRYYYYSLTDGIWNFTVEAGKINYIGNFNIEIKFFGSKMLLENQSSEALRYIEAKFPNIYQSRELVYSGPGNDDFFSFAREMTKEKSE